MGGFPSGSLNNPKRKDRHVSFTVLEPPNSGFLASLEGKPKPPVS